MLQYLLRSYLQNAASQKLRETAIEAVRQQMQGGAAETTPARERPCDVGIVFAMRVEQGGTEDLLDGVVVTHGGGFQARQGGWKGRHVVLLECGVGRDAAHRGAEALITGHQPAFVISAGFAGGLQPQVKRGEIVMADRLVDVSGRTLSIDLRISSDALARSPGVHVGRMLTVDEIVHTAAEKSALGERHQALSVDMETFAVAEACGRAGVRFMAVRVISDAVDDELPRDIDRLVRKRTAAGRLGAALGAILDRPGAFKDMWKLKEDALLHSDRLARFLSGIVPQLTPAAGGTQGRDVG
jgi:adenosylhomocysteine nucleosidase